MSSKQVPDPKYAKDDQILGACVSKKELKKTSPLVPFSISIIFFFFFFLSDMDQKHDKTWRVQDC